MAILYALPILTHAGVFLGYFLGDPLYRFGAIGSALPGLLPGQAYIDPNIGGVDQALTMRAADTIFSGALPWWNPFEGFGAPLAGEMQCSALFPFAWLIGLPDGTLLINVLLSILAGVGMMLLLRRLALSVVAAMVGSIAFEMCGTFSWLSGAWSYAIAWLPYLILGIELCRSKDRRENRTGIIVVALATALLVYSGFIETSYLEGLVGVVWAIARLVRSRSASLALCLAMGGVLGLALGSPILVAFADTLAASLVGMHAAGAAGATMRPETIIQKLLPYIYGPIFASQRDHNWGGTGGYIGFALPAVAIAGLFGRRHRTVRAVCAIVSVFGYTAIFGGPLLKLLLLIPGIRYIVIYRYIDPSITFAVAVLAALAIDDIWSSTQSIRWRLAAGYVATVMLAIIGYVIARSEISGPLINSLDAALAGWHWFSLASVVAIGAGFLCAYLTTGGKRAATIAGLIVCVEAIVYLVIPTLSYPRGATISLAGVRYLQEHLGEQRIFSLGPIGPNYGSYFGIADLDYADLPVPAQSFAYIKARLDPDADSINFFAGMTRPTIPRATVVSENLDAFARVGVKYIVLNPNTPPPSARLIPKYQDAAMAIWEVPGTTEYFTAPGCRIDTQSRTSLDADCKGTSTLCRHELNEPGWTATVDGKPQTPGFCGDIFQSVTLPANASRVSFAFTPPHMAIAFTCFIIGFGIVLAIGIWTLAAKQA